MKIKLLTAQEIIDLSDRAYGGDNTARKQLEEFTLKNTKLVNDRIYKLKKAGFKNFYHVKNAEAQVQSFDTKSGRFTQSKKVISTLTVKQLEQRALYLRKFLTGKTTVVSGAKKYFEKLARAYENAGFGHLDIDKIDIWSEFTRSEMFKASVEYDSERTMKLLEVVQRQVSLDTLEEVWNKYLDGAYDMNEVIDDWTKL